MNKIIACMLGGSALVLSACGEKPAKPEQIEQFKTCLTKLATLPAGLNVDIAKLTTENTALSLTYKGQTVITHGTQTNGAIDTQVTDAGKKIADAATADNPTPNFKTYSSRIDVAVASCRTQLGL